jgi:hypothetical protein
LANSAFSQWVWLQPKLNLKFLIPI